MKKQVGVEKTDGPGIVLVAGSGRSGTTWVGNVLGACDRCIDVFEPLAPWCELGKRAPCKTDALPNEGALRHVWDEENHEEWMHFWHTVLEGAVTDPWLRNDAEITKRLGDRQKGSVFENRMWWMIRNTLRAGLSLSYDFRLRFAKHRIVKTIRANLILELLQQFFDPRIVYILRHPCAVIGSRISNGWPPGYNELVYAGHLSNTIQADRDRLPLGELTVVEQHAIDWCIENRTAVEWARKYGWFLADYESLQVAPGKVFDVLSEHLGLHLTERARRRIGKPVSTPSNSNAPNLPWHYPLSLEDGEHVLAVCRELNCELYGRERFATVPTSSIDLGPAAS